jgi:hypothetical protein
MASPFSTGIASTPPEFVAYGTQSSEITHPSLLDAVEEVWLWTLDLDALAGAIQCSGDQGLLKVLLLY